MNKQRKIFVVLRRDVTNGYEAVEVVAQDREAAEAYIKTATAKGQWMRYSYRIDSVPLFEAA